ncbi:MAG: T9SS type A sorting domain-containing protein [Proteobacteria bacterium]|nr:T9SS type A sorting domain-containing protein [Pseudomonadota bacterium]
MHSGTNLFCNGIYSFYNGKAKYSISDINGRRIENGNFTGNKNITIRRTGVYFLKFNINGNRLSRKVIIIK